MSKSNRHFFRILKLSVENWALQALLIKKNTLFNTLFIEKGHAVSAVTTSVARILQWVGGFENDITFDYTLYAGADPESFGRVHVTLIWVEC